MRGFAVYATTEAVIKFSVWNLDDFSWVNHKRFAKFAKLSCYMVYVTPPGAKMPATTVHEEVSLYNYISC